MFRSVSLCLLAAAVGGLAGCTSDYSPNTYASNAVQQANKVEPAVVVGFRQVAISANGTVGAVSGGAAGGILGAQVGSGGMNSALGTVGGTAIGSLLGTAMEHIAGDTTGWEYIVRKSNGDLLSLTQREPTPLPIGQKVLVITGSQARIVADYSAQPDPPPPTAGEPQREPAKADAPKPDIKAEPLEPPTGGGGPISLSAPVEPPSPNPTPGPAAPPTPDAASSAPAESRPAD